MVDAGYEDTGVAKFALLDPAADINALEQVFIITQYTTETATTGTGAGDTATDSTAATQPVQETQATLPTVPSTAPAGDGSDTLPVGNVG